MRIIRAIIMTLMALLCALITVGAVMAVLTDNSDSPEKADHIAPLILVAGWTAIFIAEIVRSIKGRQWVVTTAIGMCAMMFVFAVSVEGFAIFSYSGDPTYIAVGVITGLPAAVITFVLHYVAANKRKSRELQQESSKFQGYDAEWYWDDIELEYMQLNGIDPNDDEACSFMTDELSDKFYIYGCHYISYLYVWLMKRGCLIDPADGTPICADELMNETGNGAEHIYYSHDGKLCRDEISPEILPFLDIYYERTECGQPREISYGTDYDELAAEEGKDWCMDFSWSTYHKMAERLDRRFLEYMSNIPADIE